MKISLQGPDNKKIASTIEAATGCFLINKELYKGKQNGHKFNVGQKLKLVGLQNYPEFNGEIVEITAFRQNGQYGKAYYFKANNSWVETQLNWVYEYRLEEP